VTSVPSSCYDTYTLLINYAVLAYKSLFSVIHMQMTQN